MSDQPENSEPEMSEPEKSEPGKPARVPGPMYVNRTDRELGVTGIQTFMKLPVCLTPADLVAGRMDAAVCGVPWDGTATARSGTHLGPQAIRACDYVGGYGISPPH